MAVIDHRQRAFLSRHLTSDQKVRQYDRAGQRSQDPSAIPDDRAIACVSKAILDGHGSCKHIPCRCRFLMHKLITTNDTNLKKPHSTN